MGASACIIYKYHSKADTTASWQGIMYKGDDYKEASRTYENVLRLVKKSKVHQTDKSDAGFTGEMPEAGKELKFTVSTLHLQTGDERYKSFEAVVEMVSAYDSWEVHLNLQAKKPDTQRF